MIKGVNHQVVEITKPSCRYFERVLFFVKPEYTSVSNGTLRERANMIAGSAGSPPRTKVKRRRFVSVLVPIFWASIGAGLCGLIIKLIQG